MPTLAGIYRYAIKSSAAEALASAHVQLEGLRHDRRFMVVKPDGSFVTARRYPVLQTVTARFDGARLTVLHDDHVALAEACADFDYQSFATRVWADDFSAWTTTQRLDAWFSRVLGEPVHLLWLGEQSPRYRDKIDTRVSFADGYPLLLTSEASLADLNARTDGTHVMAQFRPNLVVADTAAFAEDTWQRIRIGPVTFRVDAPCARCVMITVDPARGQRRSDGEPMQTLLRYRKGDDNQVYFGQNLVAENEGAISTGDTVEILA
ncbi:MOSC N-terminal beta barrel domain-containing protein [Salinisphaera sp. T5B8]|uniref:MOSC domain-containing protein n=1 Tax=Salinisphaera sp. T5B8 TaxID=1304154 RepID=UPI00333EBCFB